MKATMAEPEICRPPALGNARLWRLATPTDSWESGAAARALQDLAAFRTHPLNAQRLGVRNAVPLWDATGAGVYYRVLLERGAAKDLSRLTSENGILNGDPARGLCFPS